MYNEREAIEGWRSSVEAATMVEREEDFVTDDSGEMSEESSDLLNSDCVSSVDVDSDCRSPPFGGSEGYSSDGKEQASQPPTSLHWMRMSALRLQDNPALSHAMQDPGTRFRAVFILDPWFISSIGVNRWRFLLECLHDVDKSLRAYNTRLYVARGQPVAVLERLFCAWNVRQLTFQRDREPHSLAVESSVERLGESMNIKVAKYSSHTLYDPEWVLGVNNNQPIMTQRAFKQLFPLLGPPPPPVSGPDVSVTKLLVYEEDVDITKFRIPTMDEMGFPSHTLYSNSWVGGETEALRRLPIYCQLRCHQTTNQVDALFDKSSLSPYVRFGCLSVRYFLWKVKWLSKSNPAMERVVKEVTTKLLEREFYFIVAAQVPNFDMTKNNPICLQMPWECDPLMFQMWKEGRTGYPWIDAAMRQLRKEGWIHHCVRESVAAFLTRGDLWISWVAGKDVFEELLLDYEPTVSCGCWMRSSCSAFVMVPIQHYCPITFGQKIDPKGQYIRTYCPELHSFPSEYIYCPWLAPLSVQVKAGCHIGVDYPHPVVDHTTAGALCCERLQSVMNMLHKCTPSPSPCPLSLAPPS